MKKIILLGIFVITLLLITSPVVSSIINQSGSEEIIKNDTTEGQALIAQFYLELDQEYRHQPVTLLHTPQLQ